MKWVYVVYRFGGGVNYCCWFIFVIIIVFESRLNNIKLFKGLGER